MNCLQSLALLTAVADGEVDALRAHAVRNHAASCTACGARLDALVNLKQQLRAQLPYHAAPQSLRARLMAEHSPSPSHPASPALRWRWFGGGAVSGALVAALMVTMASGWWADDSAGNLPTRLVGLHTRATLSHHLIDVASSDRHQIKPWLSARLDYAIPVADWAAVGFALMGARIDRLDGRPVAVLVYRHRDHVIDVFVRPEAPGTAPAAPQQVRGFNVASAQGAQMQWLAASDLNAADLMAFAQGLARGSVDPALE